MRFVKTASALAGLTVALLSSCSSTGLADLGKKAATPAHTTWQAQSTGKNLPAEADLSLLSTTESYGKDKHGMPTYPDTVTHRVVRATAYSHMQNEPGAPGRMNAAGGILKYGNDVRSAAADWSKYPVGTKFRIKGLPHLYVVDDYGSALANTNTIDIFHPTLGGIKKWGLRTIEIDIVQWGSWERTLTLLKGRQSHWHCRDMYANARKKIDGGYAAAGFSNPYAPQG